jgi:F-type H+-transporting ATPase subunit epsilon
MSQSTPPSLSLRVISPRSLLVDAGVDEVILPSVDGELGILPGHRPLVVALGQGVLSYRIAGNEEKFSISGGYAEVQPEMVVVFAELSEDEEIQV